MAWKLYTNDDYVTTMMVLRPVPGQENTYALVGENTISLKGKVTNIISIPDFNRIKVQTGDVIGWYYLSGANPEIP